MRYIKIDISQVVKDLGTIFWVNFYLCICYVDESCFGYIGVIWLYPAFILPLSLLYLGIDLWGCWSLVFGGWSLVGGNLATVLALAS